MSSDIVAAKNIVCFRLRTYVSMRRMSGRNPMSHMVSASSSTRTSTFEMSMVPSLTWSNRRPGQATTISAP